MVYYTIFRCGHIITDNYRRVSFTFMRKLFMILRGTVPHTFKIDPEKWYVKVYYGVANTGSSPTIGSFLVLIISNLQRGLKKPQNYGQITDYFLGRGC